VSILDRRQERTERRREHIAGRNKRAAETDLRLKRSVTPSRLASPLSTTRALKVCIASLKAIRDEAQADAAATSARSPGAWRPQTARSESSARKAACFRC
jgi:site-specific DNA recombinase